MHVDEGFGPFVEGQVSGCKMTKLLGVNGWNDEPICHIDAELVPGKSSTRVAVKPRYQTIFFRRCFAFAIDLSPRHAAVDQFLIFPNRINARRYCGDAGVWPR